MSDKITWSTMLKTTASERSDRMRAPALVIIVVLVHALAVGAVMFIQGCGTTAPKQTTAVTEPPPAPVMPPKEEAMTAKPVFQPPSPVEPAPSMNVPSGAQSVTIQKGDSLSKIASRHGVSARELAEINGIKDLNKIRIGQKIMLPDYASAGGSTHAAAKAKTSKGASKAKSSAPAVSSEGPVYVVQGGDSLSKIASKHGVKINALREANKLKSDKIVVGQKLVIPTGATPAAETAAPAEAVASAKAPAQTPAMAPAPVPAPAMAPPSAAPAAPADPKLASQEQPLDYTVQDGDSLDSIAKLFIVRREDLMKLNNITDPAGIKPGMKLKIPPTAL